MNPDPTLIRSGRSRGRVRVGPYTHARVRGAMMDGMEDPAPWQRGRDQFGPWGPHGPFGRRHRGPFWLRHRGNGGPLRRDTADRLAGGVASGVAAWRGVNVTTVRIVFVLIALVSGGFCVPFYVVGWLLIPAAGEDTNIGSRARSDSAGIALAAGLATLLALVRLVGGVVTHAWFAGGGGRPRRTRGPGCGGGSSR